MDINTIRFGLRLAWGHLTGKRYPFLVQFSITNRCNYRCNYCYASYYSRPADDMPLEKVKVIIDDLARAGLFRLNLVGGEPLLRDDIGEIIHHARNRGVHCAMTTNGSLAPRKIDLLRQINMVCFSIDGAREGNDFNRGSGSFDKAVAGMDACKAAGIPMQISAVITNHTVRDVDSLVELAERYGCRVGFNIAIGQAREGRDGGHNLYADNDDIKQAFMRILEMKRMGKPILFSAEAYRYALRWPDYSQNVLMGRNPGFRPIPCLAGRYFCIVDYNGDLYPCPQLVGIMKPKNILRDGFAEAFQHADQHDCRACSMSCSNDFSLFFALHPSVLWEHFHHYGR